MGRLVGFEPTTSRTTIWRYYQLSYSRRTIFILTSGLSVNTCCHVRVFKHWEGKWLAFGKTSAMVSDR
jgi:hypothetical protein